MLAAAREGDAPISPGKYLATFILLVVAGNETTRNSITGGLLALRDFPAEREKAMARPELLRSGAAEIVRWVSPVHHMRRTAVRPVPIRAAKALMERLSSSIFRRIDAARERLSSSSGEMADRVGIWVGWFTFGPVSKLELEPRRPTSFERVLCATGIRPMVGLVRISG